MGLQQRYVRKIIVSVGLHDVIEVYIAYNDLVVNVAF